MRWFPWERDKLSGTEMPGGQPWSTAPQTATPGGLELIQLIITCGFVPHFASLMADHHRCLHLQPGGGI